MFQYFEVPIYSVFCHQDKIILSVGGGGKKYGIQNRLVVFKNTVPFDLLHNKLFEIDTESDLIQKLWANSKTNLLCGSSDEFSVIYEIDNTTGNLKKLARFQTDFKLKEPCQNDGKFNNDGTLLATGGDDTVVRVWDITLANDGKVSWSKKLEFNSHTDAINCVDFHITKPLLVSASEDKSCRIFDIEKKAMLKKLTFGEGKLEGSYKFLACHFSVDETQLYTVQNPVRGDSFFTIWNLNENIDPVKSIKAFNNPVSASCLSKEGLYFGLGSIEGRTKIINLRHFDVESEAQSHDMVTKGLCFNENSRFLVSGSPDSTYKFLTLYRPEGKFAKVTKFWIGSMLLLYIAMFIYKQFSSLLA